MKGHKPVPKSNSTYRLRKSFNAAINGDYMAWDCLICGKPIHVGDKNRWRHGDMPGANRYGIVDADLNNR
jgi:hypothetical protein